ncbi:alpha/beta hydrolase [Microtetraspora sp. AC03309]|uniref:alpha/beta hydrolase n=1 Tax=Microtetraspora sp. AC03309 TaxID=2779376 RepID=UPI001E5DCEC4|nr:alpha/beta hydrolase [Microtetraspora sp. AC03309]
MKRIIGVVAGMTVLGAAVGGAGVANARPGTVPEAVSWGPCEEARPQTGALGSALGEIGDAGRHVTRPVAARRQAPVGQVECGTLRVPLDYTVPEGQQISLALNRIKGTAPRDGNHLGVMLVNPGGPGASGRALARFVAASLPADVAARYDVIGFDPRGVGSSEPAVSCVDAESYFAAPRADNVPRDGAEERALVGRAREYAEGCGNRWAWFLPYLTTENSARDMDEIRGALGEEKISYLGYSYGTYLGAVYATLFPQRVRRLVLDSVVDPAGVWYDVNIAQDYAFDQRHQAFLDWIARHDDVYGLGRTRSGLGFAWYSMRSRLRSRPAGGVVGPSELDDVYTVGGYSSAAWPRLAQAFADYVKKGDTAGLVAAYHNLAETGAAEENSYAVYLGVQCRDAAWPRDWTRWHADTTKVAARAPFLAWPNAVYNAPCAFWAERGGTPPSVGTAKLPPVLLIQARHDAATPYQGALRVRDLFPTSRLVTVAGGDHGVALAGNACADRFLAAYLRDATTPPRRIGQGADAACQGVIEPRPITPMASGGASGHLLLTRLLMGRVR